MPLLTDANFERDVKTGVSVVRFISLWSMDSRAFEDQFRELSEEFRGKAKFLVSDINANHLLAKKEGITKIPLIVIYVNGAPVAKIADVTKRRLKEQVSYFLGKYNESLG